MTEMIDVGQKSDGPAEVKSDKKEKHYPTLYLSTKQLPKLKGMKPGDKITLLVDCEVKGYSLRSTKDQKEEGNYDIEVQKIGISKKSAKDNEDEEEETEELKKDVSERLKMGRARN